VSINAVDPMDRLNKVTVELAYQAPGRPEQARLVTVTGGESANWTFFRPDADSEARYRYRVVLFAKDGTTDRQAWVETTERQIVVGDVFPGLLEVGVEVVGRPPPRPASAWGRLVLEYGGAPAGIDARHELAIRGGDRALQLASPLADPASRDRTAGS
jgi:hypothetical protein